MKHWNPDDPKDSVVTTKISAKWINLLLFIFNFVSISLGLLALLKELNIVEKAYDEETNGIWNGFKPLNCSKEKPTTSLFSLLRRFTVEPYVKIGFRFAFMFSGMIRIFNSYWRSFLLIYEALKKEKDSLFIFGLYKILPLIMGAQVFLGAIMITLAPHIDKDELPYFSEVMIKSFFYITALYMCVVIACDWISAAGFWNYSSSCRYLVRAVAYIVFISTFVPTISEYSTYLQKIVCHTNATSTFTAVMEYMTIFSLIIFHLTEHFDIPGIELYVVEKKSL
ncbi:hypothetical protein FO519_007454 [Halicephalobus sp. NKZ332]|nr:hypothetical protein FO519_007454 [Halicephalobus sp. NKZ332]